MALRRIYASAKVHKGEMLDVGPLADDAPSTYDAENADMIETEMARAVSIPITNTAL